MHRRKLSFLLIIILCAGSLAWGAKGGPVFPISNLGEEFPVAYEKVGEFTGVGTNAYRYRIKDKQGLERAVGAGIFPNNGASLLGDPAFKKWRRKHTPNRNQWDFVSSGDPQSDFYIWASATNVDPGTKLFFTAQALTDAGQFVQALKAYYAIIVHFPKEACWSSDHSFVWYLGPECLNKIEGITSHHPEIGYELEGAVVTVKNGDDTDLKNDEFIVDPGKWVRRGAESSVNLDTAKTIAQRGYGRVELKEYENHHWRLLVDGKPYVVRGVTYHPTAVGKDLNSQGNSWMFDDEDENGRPDTPYDTWVDRNGNNRQDAGEAAIGDFKLMQDMGVNTIRLYRLSPGLDYKPKEFNKEVLRDLYKTYGIRVAFGDLLGAYTIGSGASWNDGTDYTDPVQLEHMKRLVKDFVNDHKGEDYVLMWILGNENLMKGEYGGVNATRTKAAQQPDAYLKFVNEVAEMIHQIDPDHPVAVGNLGLTDLEEHAKYAPAVDIFGANLYMGTAGFGNTWKRVQQAFDRPILITEYGCDAWNSKTHKEDEMAQAKYHQGNWEDIQLNLGEGNGTGNAIGGIVFEYLDEWWKSPSGPWDVHDDTEDSPMAFPDGWSSEEYLGIVSQGNGNKSPFLRRPRKAYYLYKDTLWK